MKWSEVIAQIEEKGEWRWTANGGDLIIPGRDGTEIVLQAMTTDVVIRKGVNDE